MPGRDKRPINLYSSKSYLFADKRRPARSGSRKERTRNLKFYLNFNCFPIRAISDHMTTLNNNNAHTINQNQITSMLIKDNNTKGTSEPMDQDQPDADYIKMFVGQVPRSMDEAQLREMFEEFGRVHTINVLRDKSTGLSKGESRCSLD